MCYRNYCGVLEVLIDDTKKLVRTVLIEVGSGFIQHKDFGAAKQCPRRTKQLTLAIAQLPNNSSTMKCWTMISILSPQMTI